MLRTYTPEPPITRPRTGQAYRAFDTGTVGALVDDKRPDLEHVAARLSESLPTDVLVINARNIVYCLQRGSCVLRCGEDGRFERK